MGYAVILGQIHTVLLLSDASKRVKSQAVFSNYGLINQLELSYLPIEVMYVYTYIYIGFSMEIRYHHLWNLPY